MTELGGQVPRPRCRGSCTPIKSSLETQELPPYRAGRGPASPSPTRCGQLSFWDYSWEFWVTSQKKSLGVSTCVPEQPDPKARDRGGAHLRTSPQALSSPRGTPLSLLSLENSHGSGQVERDCEVTPLCVSHAGSSLGRGTGQDGQSSAALTTNPRPGAFNSSGLRSHYVHVQLSQGTDVPPPPPGALGALSMPPVSLLEGAAPMPFHSLTCQGHAQWQGRGGPVSLDGAPGCFPRLRGHVTHALSLALLPAKPRHGP